MKRNRISDGSIRQLDDPDASDRAARSDGARAGDLIAATTMAAEAAATGDQPADSTVARRPPAGLLSLQRLAGNSAVNRLLDRAVVVSRVPTPSPPPPTLTRPGSSDGPSSFPNEAQGGTPDAPSKELPSPPPDQYDTPKDGDQAQPKEADQATEGEPPAPSPPEIDPKVLEVLKKKLPGKSDEVAALVKKNIPADVKSDELVFLLEAILQLGSSLRVEYDNYNIKYPGQIPLTHKLFSRRNPGVDPLTYQKKPKRPAVQIWRWDSFASSNGGWGTPAVGVTEAHWKQIQEMRDKIVYPLVRIALPRLEAAGALGADATLGQKIAHQAHSYLGVRYEWGGRYKNTEGKAASTSDPSVETGSAVIPGTAKRESRPTARLDCAGLVRQVFLDLQMPDPGSSTGQIKAKAFLVEAGEPIQPGDLIWSKAHVEIVVDDGQSIHAPSQGNVVEKHKYSASGKTILRYQAPDAAAPK